MFLKLTSHIENKIGINVSHIISYAPTYTRSENQDKIIVNGSIIKTISGNYRVKEIPEQIDKLLTISYITIKESHENRTTEVPQHPTNSQLDDSEQLQSGSCGSSCEHCSCL